MWFQNFSELKKWILYIRISLIIIFQLKLTILIFWTKYAQKGCFQQKTEKMNITIEFCLFQSMFAQGYHVPSV